MEPKDTFNSVEAWEAAGLPLSSDSTHAAKTAEMGDAHDLIMGLTRSHAVFNIKNEILG